MTQSPQIRSIVDGFVAQIHEAIHNETRTSIQDALGRLTTGAQPRPRNGATHRRAAATTAKLSSARKLQGKYLGLLRTATGNRRARAKSLAKKDGVAAAIKFLGASVK